MTRLIEQSTPARRLDRDLLEAAHLLRRAEGGRSLDELGILAGERVGEDDLEPLNDRYARGPRSAWNRLRIPLDHSLDLLVHRVLAVRDRLLAKIVELLLLLGGEGDVLPHGLDAQQPRQVLELEPRQRILGRSRLRRLRHRGGFARSKHLKTGQHDRRRRDQPDAQNPNLAEDHGSYDL